MMARCDDDRSPGATLPHRSFTEPAAGAPCSMIGSATDSTADIADILLRCRAKWGCKDCSEDLPAKTFHDHVFYS